MKPRSFSSLIVSSLLVACSGGKPDTAAPVVQTEAPPAEDTTPKAAPIPEGWLAITPQLVVPDVDAAVAFYTNAFGAEKVFTMPGPDGKTMHGEVKIGDSIIMIDIENPQMKSPKTLGGTPAGLMIYVPDADAAHKKAVEAGGVATMPVTEMFWGDRFGEITDPAGHRWGLASRVEDLTDEQVMQRAELAFPPAPPKNKKKKKAGPAEPEWKKIAGTPAASPIPAEYHTVTIGLTVDDANAAIEFYKAAFGATEKNRMPGAEGKVMHAEVTIGDSVIMISDEMPGMGAKSPRNLGGAPLMLHHYTADVDAVFAKAVAAGGKSALPVGDMFWGDRYGALVGPDGFGWGIATHVEDVPPEQMAERMKAQMAAEQQPPPG